MVSFMNYVASEGVFSPATTTISDPVNGSLNWEATGGGYSAEFCSRSLSCFPKVLGDDSERSLAINLLLRFRRNIFVHDSVVEGDCWFHQHSQNDVVICSMINLLELSRMYSDMSAVRRRAFKIGSRLWCGNRRDTLKFVAKRLPCTCLKELHSTEGRRSRKWASALSQAISQVAAVHLHGLHDN